MIIVSEFCSRSFNSGYMIKRNESAKLISFVFKIKFNNAFNSVSLNLKLLKKLYYLITDAFKRNLNKKKTHFKPANILKAEYNFNKFLSHSDVSD